MDILSFVLGVCLVEFLAMVWLWALLSLSVGCVFVVQLLVLGLLILFEVEYCLAANSVR